LDESTFFHSEGEKFSEFLCSNGTFDLEFTINSDTNTRGYYAISYNYADVLHEDYVELTSGVPYVAATSFTPCSPERVCGDHGTCVVSDDGNWASCTCEDDWEGWSCQFPICDEGIEYLKLVVYGDSPSISLVGDSGYIAADELIVYEYVDAYICAPVDCYTLNVLTSEDFDSASISVSVYFNLTDAFDDEVFINDNVGQTYFCLGNGGGGDMSSSSSGDGTGDGTGDGDNNQSGALSLFGSVGSVALSVIVAAVVAAFRF